ncbi:MAG: AGE family epimerase/isomerase [Bacteroidales bacterium]|nr:AGE family epimerase/isomerase [Bacteroidales bacterium]
MKEQNKLNYLVEFANRQLFTYIMPFWRKDAVDHEQGGFYAHINHDMSIDHNAVKGLILNARILWTFSAVYKNFQNEQDQELAQRAYNYIKAFFFDTAYRGYFWSLHQDGSPAETKKQIYAQAFVIYALSEYYKVTNDSNVLNEAIDTFLLIEKKSFDTKKNGYIEACTQEWKEIDDLRLSPKDMNEKKSMNTHLHVLEAYTNLYTAWKDPLLKKQLENLIEIFLQHIINPGDNHLELFFDEDWNSKSTLFSYGHDIEASWLLHEAALVTKNKSLIRTVEEASLNIARAAEPGIYRNKALLYEDDRSGRHKDHEFEWWAQAEAVVGFLNAFVIADKNAYLDYAFSIAHFIEEHFVDKKHGEWFFRVDLEGKPITSHEKAGFWKCPYHNARACLEILHRIKKLKS